MLLLAGAAPAFGQYYPSGAPINPSDTPSVWAQVRNSDGAIGSVWEAESPTSEHDDRAPMSARSGYTLVNAGVPSLPVLEAVYADILTATERTGALANLNRYLIHREVGHSAAHGAFAIQRSGTGASGQTPVGEALDAPLCGVTRAYRSVYLQERRAVPHRGGVLVSWEQPGRGGWRVGRAVKWLTDG